MKSFLLQEVVEKVTRAEFVTFRYTERVMSSSCGLLLGMGWSSDLASNAGVVGARTSCSSMWCGSKA